LIAKDLIAFDGTIFQVLSLPEPLNTSRPPDPINASKWLCVDGSSSSTLLKD